MTEKVALATAGGSGSGGGGGSRPVRVGVLSSSGKGGLTRPG